MFEKGGFGPVGGNRPWLFLNPRPSRDCLFVLEMGGLTAGVCLFFADFGWLLELSGRGTLLKQGDLLQRH